MNADQPSKIERDQRERIAQMEEGLQQIDREIANLRARRAEAQTSEVRKMFDNVLDECAAERDEIESHLERAKHQGEAALRELAQTVEQALRDIRRAAERVLNELT